MVIITTKLGWIFHGHHLVLGALAAIWNDDYFWKSRIMISLPHSFSTIVDVKAKSARNKFFYRTVIYAMTIVERNAANRSEINKKANGSSLVISIELNNTQNEATGRVEAESIQFRKIS